MVGIFSGSLIGYGATHVHFVFHHVSLAARAAGQLERETRSLLVVEDAASGVKAAKAAGMKRLGIAAEGRGGKLRDAGADRVVPDYRELSLREVQQLF